MNKNGERLPTQLSNEEIEKILNQLSKIQGFLLSPIDNRYLKKELIPYITPEAFHSYDLCILRAYSTTLNMLGEIPDEISNEIVNKLRRENVPFEKAVMWGKKIGHDIRGLVRACQEVISEKAKSFIYLGPTSYDIINSRYSAALRDVAYEVLIPKTVEFFRAIIERANDNADTLMIGRTHKQHANVTTVGHWLCEIASGIIVSLSNFITSVDNLKAKFSGFVGTRASQKLLFNTDPRIISNETLKLLHLKEDKLTGQTVHQSNYFPYFSNLVAICGDIAKFAEDVRGLQQTEIGEVFEKKLFDRIGSSTGAHKANPIDSENIGGQWRQLKARLSSVYDDFLTDFQRDLRDSSNKRYYIPEMICIGYTIIERATRLVKKMIIRKEKMTENIKITKGLIISESLQLFLQQWCGQNDVFIDSHDHIRKLSNKAIERNISIFDIIEKDDLIKKVFDNIPKEKKEMILNPDKYLGTCIEDVKTTILELKEYQELIEKKCKTHLKTVSYV